ncbi:MAG TPA: transglutaminaseTgpA domain-containing protein, partial [Myxococcaceae bacterium]|nr:transglutaminaseTgpA domain-containing protein [Myxococcaceae bacterium]
MTAAGRRRLRLAFRDGAALAAFASVAISGEISGWAIAAFAVGGALALFDVRMLARVPLASGIAVTGAGALLSAKVALGGMDLVVAACTFAAAITLHRVLSSPNARVDHQVLLTSLLMISGGAALSGELLFAVMVALFATFACVTLALGVVEGALPAGADFPSAPLLRRAGVCVLIALGGGAALFVVLPRLSWNVGWHRLSRGLGGISGLAEGVHLGVGSGSIKTNPRVVARVQIAPDPRQPVLHAYWIARTYGTWTGREWSEERPAQPPSERVEIRPGSPHLVHQRVELLPAYGSRTAVALVDPVAFGNAIGFRDGLRVPRLRFSHLPGGEVRLVEVADGYAYHVYSADPALDRAPVGPSDLSDADRARYVALPPVDSRVGQLAADVLQGETDPLRAAQRLQTFLGARYRYTLELPDSPEDPLADFLFERKEGHCEYFATALAVMLRTQGFAARVATGFFGGERIGDAYVLRAGDAHAWTQIWVPGRGFVNVDATPEAGRASQASPFAAWLVRQYERVDGWWRSTVLEYSLGD